MAQTIWCVLPHLDRVLADFRDRLDPKGGVLISQHFPGPQNQKYGRDILCDPEGLYEFLDRAGFQVAETLETNRHKNHHVAVWAEPKRPEAEP
jgi:hypothetical protein